MSKVSEDQKDNSYAIKNDEEFRAYIRTFSNDLSSYGQEFETGDTNLESSALEHALHKVFDYNDRVINDFLVTSDAILQRLDLSSPKTDTSIPTGRPDVFERNAQVDVELELPYSNTECWQLGMNIYTSL